MKRMGYKKKQVQKPTGPTSYEGTGPGGDSWTMALNPATKRWDLKRAEALVLSATLLMARNLAEKRGVKWN